jgi:hypothetical protein
LILNYAALSFYVTSVLTVPIEVATTKSTAVKAEQTKPTKAVAKANKKIEALDESFLLFLAELENVDGELLHPVDIKEKKEKTKAIKDEN